MAWHKLTIVANELDPETLEAALFATGAESVTLEAGDESEILEPLPGATPLWQQTRVSALYPLRTDAAALAAGLRRALGRESLPPHTLTRLEDRVWEREWLRHFRPRRCGRRLWICPNETPDPAGDAVIVRLDPGLAFGTGTHPTTALCLEWLDGTDLRQQNVLDYGCGSGILAIAALKLGAASATAFDIDEQALQATRDNAGRNDVAERLTIAAARPRGFYDILLANILAKPLIELCADFAGLLPEGGRALLSGILEPQIADVVRAYSRDFRVAPPLLRNGWGGLVCVRL